MAWLCKCLFTCDIVLFVFLNDKNDTVNALCYPSQMPVNVLFQSELFIKVLKDSYLIYQVLQTHLKICKRLSGSISTLQRNIGNCKMFWSFKILSRSSPPHLLYGDRHSRHIHF